MDAVKFFEERNRMCRFYNDCNECPAKEKKCECHDITTMNYDSIVHIVKEWSDANPRKTRQSVLLELFPNVKLDGDGIVDIDSCKIDESGAKLCPKNHSCADCRREFWLQEVE